MNLEDNVNIEEVNSFLDAVRDSCQINMLTAAPYILKEFDVTKAEAMQLLSDWLKEN